MNGALRHAARVRFLPPEFAGFFARRTVQLVGLVLIGLGAALILALLTFDLADPSFNRATSAAPNNWLGVTGAYAADLLLRSIGTSGGLIALVLAVWGWRLSAGRRLAPLWLRVSLLPPALIFAAVAFASLSPPAGWPLEVGLGGFAGELALDGLRGAALWAGIEADARMVGLAAALLALAALGPAMALSFLEWWTGLAMLARGARRAAIFMGHIVGYIVARGARGIAALAPARAGVPDRAAGGPRRKRVGRAEPHFEAPRGGAPDIVVDESPRRVAPGRRADAGRQGTLDLAGHGEYELPDLELLAPTPRGLVGGAASEAALAQNARYLETVLDDFGIRGNIVKVRPGPVVTLYELEPAPGVKASRIINLADDIARSMSAISVRVAVIPGRSVIGVELPNARREPVFLRELLASDAYDRNAAKLPLVIGKDIGGAPVIVDLARMPHLLIAGTTGSGKSVAINTMILSLLYRLGPDQCKFIMIDPKMLELSAYDDIPQLLTPVVTNPRKAVVAFKWAVREMENRYQAMSQLGVRNIESYNARVAEAARKNARRARPPAAAEGELLPDALSPLPYIVVVVDEMADLMLVAGKDVEAAVQRLAQMARAAGIHLIMATQRPSVDVITGTIKANFPTRVSFQVTSKIDSRTILGEQGAEQLLGHGDMLYMAGGGRISRVHGPFVGDQEIEDVVDYLKTQGRPIYNEEVTVEEDESGLLDAVGGGGDELYDHAVALIAREGKASTSFIQRHLQIGYNRAARIMEKMESEGVVSQANRVGKREVLIHDFDSRPA